MLFKRNEKRLTDLILHKFLHGGRKSQTQVTSLEKISATFSHKRLISLLVRTLRNEGKRENCDRKLGNRCGLIFERKTGNDIRKNF